MTNTIVLLSVLLQTNWSDTTVAYDGLMIQVGRVQTNYVVAPSTAFGRANIIRLLPPPSNTNALSAIEFAKTYPILTSQPFFGPYELIREVPQKYITFSTNGLEWPGARGTIITNPWVIQ